MGTHIYTDSETERRLVTYKSLAAKASAYKKSTSPTNKRKALTLKDINDYFNTTTESSSTAGIYVKYSVKSGKNAYINRLNVIERDLYINEGGDEPTPGPDEGEYSVTINVNGKKDKDASGNTTNQEYSTTKVTLPTGSTVDSITVTVGGVETSDYTWNGSTSFSISNVTGNVVVNITTSGGDIPVSTYNYYVFEGPSGIPTSYYTLIYSGLYTPGESFSVSLGGTLEDIKLGSNTLDNLYYTDHGNSVTINPDITFDEDIYIYVSNEPGPIFMYVTLYGTTGEFNMAKPNTVTSQHTVVLPMVSGASIGSISDTSVISDESGGATYNPSLHPNIEAKIHKAGEVTVTFTISLSTGQYSYLQKIIVVPVLVDITNLAYNNNKVTYTLTYLNTPSGGTTTTSYASYYTVLGSSEILVSPFKYAGLKFSIERNNIIMSSTLSNLTFDTGIDIDLVSGTGTLTILWLGTDPYNSANPISGNFENNPNRSITIEQQ